MLRTAVTFLEGKKTYIVSALGVCIAVLGYLNGDLTAGAAFNAGMIALTGSTVRAGSKADARAVISSRPTNDTTAVDQLS